MAQEKKTWEENIEFKNMAEKLISHFTEFSHVEIDKLIAYSCTNKDRPKGKAKDYDMSGATEPESFTNSKTYFVKMFREDWERKDEKQKLALVYSMLDRLDPECPGKILPLDYRDRTRMVRTFGADWQDRTDLPHLLKDEIDFRG